MCAGKKFFLLPKNLENVATFSKFCARLADSDKTSPPRKGYGWYEKPARYGLSVQGRICRGINKNSLPKTSDTHQTSDPPNSLLFSRRCDNGSRLRVVAGKRCERGLEPSEARVTGVPRALLRPRPDIGGGNNGRLRRSGLLGAGNGIALRKCLGVAARPGTPGDAQRRTPASWRK